MRIRGADAATVVAAAVLLCYVGAAAAERAANFTKLDAKKLRKFTEDLMRCRRVPGLSQAVYVAGQAPHAEGFGFADVETRKRADENTQFCVASLTKAFTATLLGKVLKQHRYTWDTPVTEILGADFAFLDRLVAGAAVRVTSRDLLLHRTGLPRYDYLWIAGVYTRDALLRHIKCMKRTEEFRSTGLYNNIMYALAGKVVEVLTGKSYEASLEAEVLKPLHMDSSSFRERALPRRVHRASRYGFTSSRAPALKLTSQTHRGTEAIAPAISLCSTARDMIEWIKFNLEGNGNLTDRAAAEEIQRGQVDAQRMFSGRIKPPLAPVSYQFPTYGLGWFVGSYRGLRALMHYGSFAGAYSLITLVPELRLGLFTSFNGGEQDRPWTITSLIHTYALDLALDREPWTTADDACAFPPGSRQNEAEDDPFAVEMHHKAQRALETYTGVYYHPLWETLNVSLYNATQLLVKIGHIRFRAFPCSPELKDSFNIVVVDKRWYIGPAQITFLVNPDLETLIDRVEVPFLAFSDRPTFVREPSAGNVTAWRAQQEENTCGRASGLTQNPTCLAFLVLVQIFCASWCV